MTSRLQEILLGELEDDLQEALAEDPDPEALTFAGWIQLLRDTRVTKIYTQEIHDHLRGLKS